MLHTLQQKIERSKLGVLLLIMSRAVTWHRLRVGSSDICITGKASFKDTLVIGSSKRSPRPVLQVRVSDCNFTICSAQTVFLHYLAVKYNLRDYL